MGNVCLFVVNRTHKSCGVLICKIFLLRKCQSGGGLGQFVLRSPREVDDYFERAVHRLGCCGEDGGNPCSSSFLFAEVGTEGHCSLWEVKTLRLSENTSVNLVTYMLRMSVFTQDE